MKINFILANLKAKPFDKFLKFASYTPTPLSLMTLTNFGEQADPQRSFHFLRGEIPVRLANIMQEIKILPSILLNTHSVKTLYSWYERSFEDILEFDGKDVESTPAILKKFTTCVRAIVTRHSKVVQTMASGVMEMKELHQISDSVDMQLQYFLDRFYMMRISIRMLLNQHLLLFDPEDRSDPSFVGCIDLNCNVVRIVHDAFANAKFLTEHYYVGAPDLELVLKNETSKDAIEIVYVPSHLYHILFELFKNSMRAVMENPYNSQSRPAIRVVVCLGAEDVVIRITDFGCGIPRSLMGLVFNYTYSSMPANRNSAGGVGMDAGQAPLFGFGYGLPLSRVYAKYFNGDLQLFSVEGYGTDALVYLKRNPGESGELLPVFNQTSSRHYSEQNYSQIGDWLHKSHGSGGPNPFHRQ